MKKFFFFCMMALVTMCGLNSCSDDCNHDFIEVGHSDDLVGTWTCLEEGYAEALVIKADGSALSTGYDGKEFWENVAGNIVVKNGTITMTFEDGDSWEGHFDIVRGVAFSIYTDKGDCLTFNYCKEDLSEEIVGMWVCDQGDNNIAITTYSEDGKMTMTRETYEHSSTYLVNAVSDYRVIGDLRFHIIPEGDAIDGKKPYLVARMVYTPNGTDLGDILTQTLYTPTENGVVEATTSWLRIKQTLDLPGMKYDYIKTFMTNVKGLDKDIEFMGTTFNFAKMDGVMMDKALKAILFNVEFPDANTIKYSCYYNNQTMSMEAPIVVDGNKMTVKMSQKNPAYKDTDLYTFQDQDNTQMHMYMPTYAFVNFFGNMQVTIMEQLGQLDTTDAAAVKAVFQSIDDAVETINVSFVMHSSK